MADKPIDQLAPMSEIFPSDLFVAQHNGVASKLTGEALTNFFKNYIGPLVVDRASKMTDRAKVYVYIGNESGYTNGNWYYWNGSAWVSGGVYNSEALVTDTTLSHSGMAADAASTGEAVGNLFNDSKKLLNPGRYAEYFGQYLVPQLNGSYPFTQGMCIGNGKMYQMVVTTNDVDAGCYIVDLTTGEIEYITFDPESSHFNDVTYVPEYNILLASQGQKISVLNADTLERIKIVNISPRTYKIAYVGNATIAIMDPTPKRIYYYKVNQNYALVYQSLVDVDIPPYTNQGMCFYDGRLYLSFYITHNSYYPVPEDYDYGGMIVVYDLKGNTLNRISLENCYGELEGVDVYNGDLIISYQRRWDEVGCIQSFLKLPLYAASCDFTSYEFNHEGSYPGEQALTVYVNRNYTGFFCDGSQDKPFLGLQEAVNHCQHLTNYDITLNVSGDAGLVTFPPSNKIYSISDATIRRINSFTRGELFLTNCTIGNSSLTASPLYLRYSSAHIRGCTLTCNNNFCIDVAYSRLILEGDPTAFVGGSYGMNSVCSDIISTAKHTFTNIANSNYNLRHSYIRDLYLPTYSESGFTEVATYSNGVFTSDSDLSSVNDLMNLTPGYYRVSISGTTIFPTNYGIVEIFRANTYGMVRFSPINASVPRVYERTFNYGSRTWYDADWRLVTPRKASELSNDSTVSGSYVSDALDNLKTASESISGHMTFFVNGTLKSNVTTAGNIFTQSASDSRITQSTNIASVTIDDETRITSTSIEVTTGTGSITITGTTEYFTGTNNVVVELYN